MRCLLSETTGLLVDVQQNFAPHIADFNKALKRMQIMTQGLAALKVPIAVTEQNNQKLGATVPELTQFLDNFSPMNKMEFSCFDNQGYNNWLKANPCKNIIIYGIEAHICILQTAVDLKNAGYTPYIVWDAVSSRTIENKEIARYRFQEEGIVITSSESILFELTRSFEHPMARTISSLIK
ncbi:MAG: isochorismatase family protein [Brevinema sp.]